MKLTRMGGGIAMRIIIAAVIALYAFTNPQTNIAVAQQAPAWIAGEYAALLKPPGGPVNTFIQIKNGTIEADGRLSLDIQIRTDRNNSDWTPAQSYEAKLVSPERATIAFTTQRGSKFNLIAKPDDTLSGSISPGPGLSENATFTKRK
jgi:hypothetical protein